MDFRFVSFRLLIRSASSYIVIASPSLPCVWRTIAMLFSVSPTLACSNGRGEGEDEDGSVPDHREVK